MTADNDLLGDDAAGGQPKEIVCRIFCCPSENTEVVRQAAKFAIAAYLNVPVYAEFHRWLGRGELLQPMWDQWKAGDRVQGRVRGSADRGGVEVRIAPDLPAVRADRRRLLQVLQNLLDNAVKYSGESRKVVVRLASGDGHVTFEVEDFGIRLRVLKANAMPVIREIAVMENQP